MKVRILTVISLAAALLMLPLAGCSDKPGASAPDPASQATTPQDPAPTQPAPTEPAPTNPAPTEPAPTEPAPTEPAPTPPAPTEPAPPAPPAGEKGAAVAALAQKLIGKPFKMGGVGPDEFDNSGFIYHCFKESGVSVPRLTSTMYKAGAAVEKADLQPGDVVFFYVDTEGVPQFAGIYVGDQKFISCNNENNPTKEQDMRWDYYAKRFVGARRFA